MRGTVTAVQAISMAGGFKNSAKHSQVLLFRRVGTDVARTEILNLKEAMTASAKEPNIDLRSGDISEPTNQEVRICINAAEGDVELEL